MAGGFNLNTRQRYINIGTITKGSGNQYIDLPKTGILGRVYLAIRGAVAGSLSNENPLGMASVVRQVRLTVNQAIELVRISGAGYHYLARENMDSHYVDPIIQSNAADPVTATTFALDMVLPIQMNMRDPFGLFMLQNAETLVRLAVDWEADATVATGATVTATCDVMLEIFTVPTLKEDWPPFSLIHSLTEDQTTVPASGDFHYSWPRGNVYLKTLFGMGIGDNGGSASDLWDSVKLVVNHGDVISYNTPINQDQLHAWRTGRVRPLGAIYFDEQGSSGLGDYGALRDPINSELITDLETIITANASGNLFIVREELIQIGPAAGG